MHTHGAYELLKCTNIADHQCTGEGKGEEKGMEGKGRPEYLAGLARLAMVVMGSISIARSAARRAAGRGLLTPEAAAVPPVRVDGGDSDVAERPSLSRSSSLDTQDSSVLMCPDFDL